MVLKDIPVKNKIKFQIVAFTQLSINELTVNSFFSVESWFVSDRKVAVNDDESCWLRLDEYLFILYRLPIVINGDDVGLWR